MKRLICLTMAVMMVLLSGCGKKINVSVTSPSSDTNETTAEETAPKTESTDAMPEKESPQSDALQPEEESQTVLPVYKLIRKYYSQNYQGKNKTDGDGDSLENQRVYDGTNETLMVADESKDLFPDLYETLNEAAKKDISSSDDNAKTQIEAASEDADSSFDDKRPFMGPYTDYSRICIMRSDAKIISYTQDYSSFTGGAHGIYGRFGYTYDVKNGKKLELTDVVDTTSDELVPVLKEKILQTGDPDDFDDLDENLKNYKLSGDGSFVWFLDFDGVHFYFGPYEIAAYAIGDTDVVIGYDEFQGKVKDEYLTEPDTGYIVSGRIRLYASPYDSDTDTSLHFVCNTDDKEYDNSGYIDCTSLTLKQADKSATAEDEDFSFNYDKDSCKQYHVVTKDGKEYIYVCALVYDDYTDIIVYDITGGDIKLSGVYTCRQIFADLNTEYSGEYVFTDPENLYLGDNGNLLGTYTCYGRCVVGSDGLPESVDKDFAVCWVNDKITSKKDVEVTVLDENNNEQGTETMPAGTEFIPVRTDNSSYMDIKLDDGKTVRLKYSKTDYPVEINGEKVDDLFDGLIYAS